MYGTGTYSMARRNFTGGINKRVAVSSECWVCIFLLKGTGVVHHQHLVSREGGEILAQLLAPGPEQ